MTVTPVTPETYIGFGAHSIDEAIIYLQKLSLGESRGLTRKTRARGTLEAAFWWEGIAR
jgi:hypothetical protein